MILLMWLTQIGRLVCVSWMCVLDAMNFPEKGKFIAGCVSRVLSDPLATVWGLKLVSWERACECLTMNGQECNRIDYDNLEMIKVFLLTTVCSRRWECGYAANSNGRYTSDMGLLHQRCDMVEKSVCFTFMLCNIEILHSNFQYSFCVDIALSFK